MRMVLPSKLNTGLLISIIKFYDKECILRQAISLLQLVRGLGALLAFCSLSFLMACSSSGSKSSSSSITQSAVPATQNYKSFAGSWYGMVQNGADFIYLQLELKAVSNQPSSFTGNAYLLPFSHKIAGFDVKNDIKSEAAQITVKYDANIQTFVISSVKPTRRGTLTRILSRLGGVRDTQKDVLVGLRNINSYGAAPNVGNQFFLLSRKKRYSKIQDVFEEFTKVKAGGPHLPAIFSMFGGPSVRDIESWASKLYQELPNTDLYRVGHGHLELLAIKLFRDEYFKSNFGQKYDELSWRELAQFWNLLIKEMSGSRNVKTRSTASMANMFAIGFRGNGAKQTTFWVLAQRHMLRWHKQQMTLLSTLPKTKNSSSRLVLLENEIKKVQNVLLWPSEITKVGKTIELAKAEIAFPALQGMLAGYNQQSSSFELLHQLDTWSKSEPQLFNWVSAQQKAILLTAADSRINQVLNDLTAKDSQSLQSFLLGMNAVKQGNRWYESMVKRYGRLFNKPQVQQVVNQFKSLRQTHWHQASLELELHIQSILNGTPSNMSAQSDRQRKKMCGDLKQLEANLFRVPGDLQHSIVAKNRIKSRQSLGIQVGLLPPESRGQCQHIKPVFLKKDSLASQKAKSTITVQTNNPKRDSVIKALLQKPIRNLGFGFKSNTVWALFHGRFDLLNRNSSGGGIASSFANKMNIHPRVHSAFINYVGLASQKYDNRQVWPTREVFWRETETDRYGNKRLTREGYGKVKIAVALAPFYEQSYKIATKLSSSDGLLGKNGLGLFEKLISNKIFSGSRVRADGELQMFTAQWEKDILQDLTLLMNNSPERSMALWQFQENLLRALEGKRSLQSLYGWK